MRLYSILRRQVLITVILSISIFSKGQNKLSPEADSLAQFVRNIVTFNQMYPQEKVYLHFDNTGYFMGETIWFKAYVVNPINNRPNILSRVLYVELLTPEGRVLQTQKLKIENGQCNGQFSLAELLHPGYYEIRAYTALMLNWENAPIFSRVFPIFNAPQTEEKNMYDNPRMLNTYHSERLPQMRAKASKMENINIHFFPEGGHLIEGIPSNIAFKVTDKHGNALTANGIICNQNGEQINIWETIHQGMGTTMITPKSGETYYAEIKNNTGKVERFPLPTTQKEGYVMTINNMEDDTLRLKLMRPVGQTRNEALGLSAMCRGQVILFSQIEWKDQDYVEMCWPKNKLIEGICQFTLFNTSGQIYAERLAFIPPQRGVKFSISGNKTIYQAKEPIELNFKLTDLEGNPLSTIFSLSVRDADTETPSNRNYAGNISANLLLGSDLKGYIHDVDYYLEADDIEHRRAVDLLLCTQGWRRYDWKQMINPNQFKVKYPAEEGIVIMGDLTSIFRNRIKKGANIKVYLYNGYGEQLSGSCTTDEEGKFAFLSEDFNGRWNMHIITKEGDKQKEMNVNLKKLPKPQGRVYNEEETNLFLLKENSKTEIIIPDTLSPYQSEDEQRWENLLPTVKIESEKEWQTEFIRKWNNMIYDMEEERLNMDDTGENYLIEFYRWLEQTNPFFTYDYSTDTTGAEQITAKYKGRPVRFFVSRIGTSKWIVENDISINIPSLTINDIEAIAINDKPNAEMAMIKAGLDTFNINQNSVLITIFVRNDYFRHKEYKGHRKTMVQGFSAPYKFYMPDYSYTELPDEKDFRRTLYWAPYIVTNKQGEANIKFFNSPNGQRIKVNAETITFSGMMGSFTYE